MAIKEIVTFLETSNDAMLKLVREARPYRIPKGYMPWNTLSAIIALNLIAKDETNRETASRLNDYKAALWFVQSAPMYCLAIELLRAFEQSDVLEQQEVLANLQPPLPTFLVLFPRNAIQTPEGASLDYVVVHLSDRNHPERSEGSSHGIHIPYLEHDFVRNLHWTGVDSNENVWFSGMGLQHDGKLLFSEDDAENSAISWEENEFLKQMRSIVVQCMLTLSYRPDLSGRESGESEGVANKSHSGNQLSRQQIMVPRWLGKNYRRSSPSKNIGPSRSSQREHWRRGHWRRVAHGVGRSERRWTWIEPTIVGIRNSL